MRTVTNELRPSRISAAGIAALGAIVVLVAPSATTAQPTQQPGAETGQASPSPKSTVETVVVTAEHRRVNIQKVPIAITALSSAAIATRGITSTADLSAAVPGLVINNAANVGNPYIRGVGSNLFDPSAEQSVAIYVDGIYIAAPEANLFALNNVARIEVLKGPQGTLFGRNATGGVIQIITKDPSLTPYAEASVGFGSYDTVTSSLYATGGITNTLAGDLAVMYANQGQGYGKNLTTGAQDDRQAIGNIDARTKLAYRPDADTRIVLSLDYAHDVSTNAYQKVPGTFSPFTGNGYPGAYNSQLDENGRDRVNTGGVSLNISHDFGFMKFVNLASYRATNTLYALDDDVSALPVADVILAEHAHNISEELQLISPENGWLKWLAGAYYFDGTGAYPEVFIDGILQVSDKQVTQSESGFGQATASLFGFNLTGGLRYTNEQQNFSISEPVAFRQSQTVDRLTYRLALDREIFQDVLAYVSYNRGFKSGGFNLLEPGNTFKPEILDATEIGIKSQFLNHRVSLNLAGFYYNYQNIQLVLPVLGATLVRNAAGAHMKGFEGDLTVVPLENLTINAGISYIDGRYTNYPGAIPLNADGIPGLPINEAGKRTVDTPPVTATLNASYRAETRYGSFTPSGSVVFNDGYFWQTDNRLVQPAYTLVNASLMWASASEKYSVRLWGRNLANAGYYIARITPTFVGDAQEQAAPRTVGATLRVRF